MWPATEAPVLGQIDGCCGSVEELQNSINVLNHFLHLLHMTSHDGNVYWPPLKEFIVFFYLVRYSNGQILNILNTNVKCSNTKK